MIYGAQFGGVRQQAANLGGSVGNYTAEQFKEEYPQFCNADGKCHLPDALLNEIVRMANVSVQPDKWLDSWHYAVGLYVAHYVTLQLRTFAESSATPAQAAASGALVGVVKSATLGDSSVTYDTSALTAGTEDWGDLNATTYGQMLANCARFMPHIHAGVHGSTGGPSEPYTGYSLLSEGADGSVQSEDIKGWENGKVLPLSKDKKYIILNPALKAGDKVLLLRVQRGQKFVVLSRVYEGGD